MSARGWLRRGLRIISIAAVALLCVLFVRRLDLARVGAALASASLPLVTLAALVNLVQLVARALAVQALLAPVRVVKLDRLYRYNLALYAGNNLLPVRAGEWVRIELLRAREQVPRSIGVGVALIERLLDAIALLLLALPLPLVLPGLPRAVTLAVRLLGSAGVIALAATWALTKWHARVPGRIGRLLSDVAQLGRTRTLATALGWALVSHVVDAVAITICFRALHLTLPLLSSLLVLLGVTLALVLPSAPAGIGALEVGAVAALHVVGVDDAHALAFALVYHAMQVVPVTALGILPMRQLLR
jgi:uncharacterized membrane protein YbhN (UPF0104 family)